MVFLANYYKANYTARTLKHISILAIILSLLIPPNIQASSVQFNHIISDTLFTENTHITEQNNLLTSPSESVTITSFTNDVAFTESNASDNDLKLIKSAKHLNCAETEPSLLSRNKSVAAGKVGTYTTKIKLGILDIKARFFGKGYWGRRVKQNDQRIDAFELKINPNNESFYIKNSEGSFVQFENLIINTLQDRKLVMDQSSIYHVLDKPPFLREEAILKPAKRQVYVAKSTGYKFEWLVSAQKAVDQLIQYFTENNVDIVVRLLAE